MVWKEEGTKKHEKGCKRSYKKFHKLLTVYRHDPLFHFVFGSKDTNKFVVCQTRALDIIFN